MDDKTLAAQIWDSIQSFSEKMLERSSLAIFKAAKNMEPTKSMLANERAYAVNLISQELARIRAEARAKAIEECIDYLADCDLFGQDGAWAQSIRSNLLGKQKL